MFVECVEECLHGYAGRGTQMKKQQEGNNYVIAKVWLRTGKGKTEPAGLKQQEHRQ